jgi:monoamine oxidase
MSKQPDVIVIGAGAAGLAASARLGRAGLSVLILEARDCIGGRMFTKRDSEFPYAIELGAEFIHGMSPEIWQPLQQAQVKITEVSGQSWCVENNRICACDFFDQVDEILRKMNDRSPDESFLDFLNRCCPKSSERAKQRALSYVVGFNAADPALVGVHWLVQGMRAEEPIEGDRAFRAEGGYAQLVDILRSQLPPCVSLQTGTVVNSIRWRQGEAELAAKSTDRFLSFRSARILITVPLGILKAKVGELGTIDFSPALPAAKIDALNKLEMGKVTRVVLRFRERFWDTISLPDYPQKTLADMSFLFSQDKWFPTWWTTMPDKSPLITGWAPFDSAERLSDHDEDFVVERALRTLASSLGINMENLEGQFEVAYFHDWQNDPFSRGAYSYGKVGADGAQQALAAPVANTLYFAGEATDITGHNGTVHGAIASGYRAAAQILRGLGHPATASEDR